MIALDEDFAAPEYPETYDCGGQVCRPEYSATAPLAYCETPILATLLARIDADRARGYPPRPPRHRDVTDPAAHANGLSLLLTRLDHDPRYAQMGPSGLQVAARALMSQELRRRLAEESEAALFAALRR
jgi:hypothetical protein